MVAPLIPVIIGGQLIRMAAPTAMTLLRSGAARALPRMRDVGSQSAGSSPAYGYSVQANAVAPRFNPLGRGAAGLGAAGMVAAGDMPPEERAPAPEGRVPIPEGLIRELNARGADGPRGQTLPAQIFARAPVSEEEPGYFGDAGRRLSGAFLSSGSEPGYAAPRLEDAPPPPRRPFGVGAPMPPRRPETGAADSILRRIFSGEDYQSNSRPVVENRKVNWGDSENAADFFRADRAAREMGTLPPVERASGGQVGQGKAHKDAALVKALEIIERLMSNGR